MFFSSTKVNPRFRPAVRQQGQCQPAAQERVLRPKLRIEIVDHDALAATAGEAIVKSAQTGAIGDGKIWVSPVESALHVRSGGRSPAQQMTPGIGQGRATTRLPQVARG